MKYHHTGTRHSKELMVHDEAILQVEPPSKIGPANRGDLQDWGALQTLFWQKRFVFTVDLATKILKIRPASFKMSNTLPVAGTPDIATKRWPREKLPLPSQQPPCHVFSNLLSCGCLPE